MTTDTLKADAVREYGVDTGAAESFLKVIDPDADFFTFQTFDDTAAKRRELARVVHGTFRETATDLARLNTKGAGVFLTINTTDGKGRAGGNILRIRAVFADLDGAPLDPVLEFRLPPHLVVETSPGRFHAYWLAKGVELAKFGEIQQRIAAQFGGDPAVKDPPRVMRLPGFFHRKGDPLMVKIIRDNAHLAYTAKEISAAFPPLKTPHATGIQSNADGGGVPEGQRNVALASMAGSMRRKGMGQRSIEAALLEENLTRCRPPLPEGEVRSIAASISRYEPEAEKGAAKSNTPDGYLLGDYSPKSQEQIVPWPDPVPFDDYSNLPNFPTETLPPLARDVVEAVSECYQVDAGLPATIYLGVLSACLQKKFEVDLETHREPANLFICPVLPSGERKSATFKTLTAPVYEFQKNKAANLASAVRASENTFKIFEDRVGLLQKKAARCNNAHERQELIKDSLEIREEMAKNPRLKAPVLIADDITPEKLGEIMSENGERLSVMSSEGHIFEITAGLYSDKTNIDLLLKSHAGDPYSSGRIGRGSYAMTAPALTLCLTVQPDVVRELGKNRKFLGRGFLARILFSKNRPRAGTRGRSRTRVPESLLTAYAEHITNMLNIPSETWNLKLTPGAQNIWDSFYDDIEGEMKPGRPLDQMKAWGSKLPGAVARIAGLLHHATHAEAARQTPITETTVGNAAAIGGYFREHALAAFDLMGEDRETEAAKKILEYLIGRRTARFKAAEILKNKHPFKKMDQVTPALRLLEERNIVRARCVSQRGTGRPAGPEFEVNPKIKTIQNGTFTDFTDVF